MLSNFKIYGKAKNAKRKVARNVRAPSPPSPASFASPEIFDIHERPHSTYGYVPRTFAVPQEQAYSSLDSFSSNNLPAASPRVQLEFDSGPLLGGWFPPDMLKSDDSNEGGSTSIADSRNESSNLGLDDESDVILDHKTTEISTFGLLADSDDSHAERNFARRPIPAPITIPNPAVHRPKVQVQRTPLMSSHVLAQSAYPFSSHPGSRPDSLASADDTSTISGTTLARALIANSFILSNDTRSSRHRSTGVVRQDSATLPRGEYSLLNSPYWRDRRISGGDVVILPDSSVPPVPPIPTSAGLVLKGGNQRSSITACLDVLVEMSHGPETNGRSSTSSSRPSSADGPVSLSRSSSHSRSNANDIKPSRRISRIEEAPSPAPSTPLNMPSTDAGQASFIDDLSDEDSTDLANETIDSGYTPGQESIVTSEPPTSGESGQDRSHFLQFQINSPSSSEGSPALQSGSSPTSSPHPNNGKWGSKRVRSGKISLDALPPPGRVIRDTRSENRLSSRNEKNSVQLNRSITLLPIGERPHSLHVPHSPLSPGADTSRQIVNSSTIRLSSLSQVTSLSPSVASLSTSSKSVTLNVGSATSTETPETSPDVLYGVAPLSRGPFLRDRSGSTPKPITVIRDSRDMRVYNITVSDGGNTPSTGSGGHQQTFPETPSSPPWSSGTGFGSPGMMPQSTDSIAFNIISPLPNGPFPPLSRATTVSGAVNTNLRPSPSQSGTRPTSAMVPEPPMMLSPIGEDSFSDASTPPLPLQPATLQDKDLPNLPPPSAPVTPGIVPARQPTPPASISPSDHLPTLPPPPPPFLSPPLPPPPLPLAISTPLSQSSTSFDAIPSASFTPSYVAPPPYQASISRSTSQVQIPTASEVLLLNGQIHVELSQTILPSASPPSPPSPPPSPPPPAPVVSQPEPPAPLATINVNGRRTRIRPPLPIGPRKPSGGSLTGSLAAGVGRSRNGSSSSSVSVTPPNQSGDNSPNGRRLLTPNGSSLKFQTLPLKWRGYTMDAAKWTFTSHQLQSIVSRAIKQSAEASSIRLLKLETIDNELPEEMDRLTMLQTDIKTKYKVLTRKRWTLMGSLCTHLSGEQLLDPAAASRLLDSLAEVSASLDQLTEELHSVTDQIGQLKNLRDVHSASALAMALRKLNSSFLGKATENGILRERIEALEAERDEAWKQAEDIAHEFDTLNEKIMDSYDSNYPKPASSASNSLRSSRVMAIRKTSLRASKAGLRSSSTRRSNRSSVASGHRGSSIPSTAMGSPFMSCDIPPVPPIPMTRPLGIVTSGLPTRSSVFISSTTPSSETRAMVQAQEELYDMLGIPLEEPSGRPRPQSMSGALAAHQQDPAMTSEIPVRPLSEIGTPGSRATFSLASPGYHNDARDSSTLATLLSDY